MFKHYFERIADQVAIYPIISLSIFVLFFAGLLIWVATADKNYIAQQSQLPLEDSTHE
jgi:cytochrome c oxidase cbb3-type subunit 4